MKNISYRMNIVLCAVLALAGTSLAVPSWANELALVSASPLTGVAFDDLPLALPVQKNFQTALSTVSGQLGRTCGKMETYGWRMGTTEQGRVDQIFEKTVGHLRTAGYSVAPQTASSLSSDLTLLTVDKTDKHFIFLWSAGDLGLVLSLCETTAPMDSNIHAPVMAAAPAPSEAVGTLPASTDFTPVGEWTGLYTCAQGETAGTLQINPLHGKDFEGVFKFSATAKNPSVPSGSYGVYGQYDADAHRIQINPGAWIVRPKNFYNTIITGKFDPAKQSFSAYFEGVEGCTSFESVRDGAAEPAPVVNNKKHKKVALKKKAVQSKPVGSASKGVALPMPVLPAPTLVLIPPTESIAPPPSDATVPLAAVLPQAPVAKPAPEIVPVTAPIGQ